MCVASRDYLNFTMLYMEIGKPGSSTWRIESFADKISTHVSKASITTLAGLITLRNNDEVPSLALLTPHRLTKAKSMRPEHAAKLVNCRRRTLHVQVQ